MIKETLIINEIPKYLNDLLRDTDSELFKEQIRQKEYSQALPVREGQRHVFLPWSGGLDSTTSLLIALESSVKVTTVNFNYGQSYYEKEKVVIETLINKINEHYDTSLWVNHLSVDISWLDSETKKHFGGEWGHIFPVRNYILLSEVFSFAKKVTFSEIWFSCVQGEIGYSGGDKSIVFLNETQKQFIKENVLLIMPLIGMGKSDIVRWAMQYGHRYDIIKRTISCFSGDGEKHCGKCMSCFNRAVGFNSAGKLEDVGFKASKENLKDWIEYYQKRIQGSNPYSVTKRKDILDLINILNA